MEHINDSELTEFVSGRLPASRSEDVRKHIVACPECSERHRETAKMWETLGRWDIDAVGHNIADKVLASVKESQTGLKQNEQSHIVKGDFWKDVLRVAALIVIAVGLGQKLGRIGTGQSVVPTATMQNGPQYIAALGLEWSSELTWLIMEDDSPKQEIQ
jgi:anti-sigma factor RsiW